MADGVERLALAGGGPAATGPGGRIMPLAELALPGRHNVSNALAAIGVALLFGVAPDAIRAAAATFAGVEHRLEPVGEIDGVRFVNDSQGTQPDAVIAALRSFTAPIVLIAGGRDKGVELAELAGSRCGAGRGGGPDRRERSGLEGLFRAAGLVRTEQAASLEAAVERAAVIAREARPAGGGRPGDPDGAGDRPAQPGSGQLRHVHRLRGPRTGLQGRCSQPHPAWPGVRPQPDGGPMSVVTSLVKPTVRSRPSGRPSVPSVLRRETHAPDYVVLVAVVALTAIGVLMVYSSSAMEAYAGSANSFAVVGPQVVWGALGLVA